jgi:2,5-dioxopentanoate dehydrogenase
MEVARQRPEPIPVYAEMSSINPIVLLPGALAARTEALVDGFFGSLTLGAGQFCTNPGLVIAIDGPDLDRFVSLTAKKLASSTPAVMLTPGIAASHQAIRQQAGAPACAEPGRGSPALFEVAAAALAKDPSIAQEVFGASALVVRCADSEEMAQVLRGLEGQLTGTLHFDDTDRDAAARLLPLLVDRAGRILANGWPTGVEVTRAMVHGGPFPATSDGRTTSVGTLAMQRFVRPVCYQDLPDALLPPALRTDNPWQLPRRIDGVWETTA